MSDFFNRMKSIFVVDSGNSNLDNTSTSGTSTSTDQSNSVSVSSVESIDKNSAPGKIPGSYTDQFYKVLFDSLEKNNQPGFDYLEFKKALEALANISMDERTRFLSAYAGAQASGINADILVQSAGKYLTVLEAESNNFNDAVDAQWNKQIDTRKNDMKQLSDQIQSKTEQMTKLENEIKEHQSQLTSLKDDIGKSQEKIETAKANFMTTYKSLTEKIKGDIDRIKTYIK